MSGQQNTGQHQLPPCKVCGLEASGFHYGVNTCDACKAFFQRSLRRQETYDCSCVNRKTTDTSKSDYKKTDCRHCRYEKCLSAGMSVRGIKIGRYTSRKKADDILERRRLEQRDQNSEEQYDSDPIQQQIQDAETDRLKDDSERRHNEWNGDDEDLCSESEIRHLIDVIVQAQHRQVPNITEHLRQLPDLQSAFVQSGHQHSSLCSCGLDSHRANDSGGAAAGHVDSPECCKQQEFRVASRIARIFEMAANDLKSCDASSDDQSNSGSSHDQHSTTSRQSSATSEPSDTTADSLSPSASVEVLHLSSLSESNLCRLLPSSWRVSCEEKSDDERRHVLSRWLVTLEKGLRGIVGFVKEVPGFNQLSTNDKINLVKRSICESWLVTRHTAFNEQLGCYTAYNGFTFDLVKAVGEQFSSVLFSAAARMQALRLTDEETFVVKAFVFFFTDGIELENREQVEVIQRRLLVVLKYLFAQSHADDPLIVARLIAAITQLRNVTHSFRRLW